MSPTATIRPVRPGDVPAVVAMVHELADFERGPSECHLTTGQLTRHHGSVDETPRVS